MLGIINRLRCVGISLGPRVTGATSCPLRSLNDGHCISIKRTVSILSFQRQDLGHREKRIPITGFELKSVIDKQVALTRHFYSHWDNAPGAFESGTCFGTNGHPLVEYESETEATKGAAYVFKRYGRRMKPYQCGSCDQWHIAPVRRRRVKARCACTSTDGSPKQLYQSRAEAERRADMLMNDENRHISVKAYRCPLKLGWHITTD